MNNHNSSTDEYLCAVGAVHPGGTVCQQPLCPTLVAADGCWLESPRRVLGWFVFTLAVDEATVRRVDV